MTAKGTVGHGLATKGASPWVGAPTYYQMRLCRIWSRNAENFSALFYVLKNVTKSHCIDCGTFPNWAFWLRCCQCFDNFLTTCWQFFFTFFLLCGIKSYDNFDNFLTFFWQLFVNFLTSWHLFENVLTTFWQLFFFFLEFCLTFYDTDLIGS
jgi:hypothetical protein